MAMLAPAEPFSLTQPVSRLASREAIMSGLFGAHQLPNLGETDLPREPVFIIRPPPGLEGPGFHVRSVRLLSFGQECNHPPLIAHTESSDSIALTEAGTFGLMADEQGACKKQRPCKGKRNRYKKLVKHLEAEIQANALSFDFNMKTLPPSLQANEKQRERLRARMEQYQHRVKIGEVPKDA